MSISGTSSPLFYSNIEPLSSAEIKPGIFCEPLQKRVEQTEKQGAFSYKKCRLLPTDSELQFVFDLFLRQQPTTWGIRKVYCIYREESVQRFNLHLLDSEQCAEDTAFEPKWPQEEHCEERAKVIERWKKILGAKQHERKVYVLPLWHGSTEDNIAKICKLGFQIRGRDVTDPGFFGRGIYFTNSSKYAVNGYSKDGHVLLSWVSMRLPFPVIKQDYESKKLLGKGPQDDHDAHYIPVVSAKPDDPFHTFFEPATLDQSPTYDEFVVFNPAQALPAFWVELQPNLLLGPTTTPLSVESLLNFVVNVLQHDVSNESEKQKFNEMVKPLLKALALMVKIKTYPKETDCSALVEQFIELRTFFDRNHVPDLSRTNFLSPFVEVCQDVLREWKTTFASELTLTAFPLVLERLLPNEGWQIGCDLLLTMVGKERDSSLLTPRVVLKKFFEKRPKIPLSEFAIKLAIASENQKVRSHLSLVEGVSSHLIGRGASEQEHERIYSQFSAKESLEPLKAAYLHSVPTGALFDKLSSISNRSGYRQKMRIEQAALMRQIEAITQIAPTKVRVTALIFKETRYLKREIIDAKLDLKGDIKTDLLYQANSTTGDVGSNHPVCQVEGEGYNLHLKSRPSQPMQEYAIYNLSSRLAGTGVPPSYLVRFDVDQPEQNSYPVLVSQTVVGTNLKEVLREPKPVFDRRQLTHILILSLVTRPGDGRASNFIVTPRGEVFCVDNDASFVEPIVESFFGWRTVNFKSILYCLNEEMLDSDVLQLWSKLSIELILDEWLKDLRKREDIYNALFSPDEKAKLYNHTLSFTPSLVLRGGAITTIYTQIALLQKVFKESPPKKGIDLLRHLITFKGKERGSNPLGPRLFKFYSDAYKIKATPSERLQAATGTKQASLTPAEAHKAGIGKIPTSEEIRENGHFSLAMLQNEFRTFGFDSILEGTGAFAAETDEKLSIHCDFSAVNLENGTPDLERQRQMLWGLQQWLSLDIRQPDAITLQGCAVLSAFELIPFLHKKLSYLDIRGSAIESLPLEIQECKLKELYLTGCSALPAVANIGYLYNGSLSLPYLKTLETSGCGKLTEVLLEAPQLREWGAKNNPNLERAVLQVDLKTKIDLTGSPKIEMEGIVKASLPDLCRASMPYDVCREIGSYYAHYMRDLELPQKGEPFGDSVVAFLQSKQRDLFDPVTGFKPTKMVMNFSDGDEGVKRLANLLPFTEVSFLRLSKNNITDEGALALAAVLPKTNISVLELFGNKIGTRGAEAIVETLDKTKVSQLNLGGNQLTIIIKAILEAKAPEKARIIF